MAAHSGLWAGVAITGEDGSLTPPPRTHARARAQVADIPVDHPSTSKQHAVLQFRQVTERNEFGDTKSLTKCAPTPSPSPPHANIGDAR